MNDKDIRAKKATIRKDIKERIQAELDERKKEIKKRIRGESISIEEKRAKYRQEAHEEKLRLMERAKEEFRARKRMLGLDREEEQEADLEEILPSSLHSPSPEEDLAGQEVDPTAPFQILEEEDDAVETGSYHHPEGAFVYSDDEEDFERHLYERPTSEGDIEPLGSQPLVREPPGEPDAAAGEREAHGIIYYASNLILHPVVTLDEFDEYLTSSSRLVKVGLFYLVSLLPVILFGMIGDEVGRFMPRGLIGVAISSMFPQQSGSFMLVGQTILNLLVFSFSIAIVNYFVANKANFFTLVIYFGFVEAVTRIATYTLILLAVFGVMVIAAQPQLAGPIGGLAIILLLAFIIWTFALNMIVLMSAYDYSFVIAFVLLFAANMVRSIISHIAMQELGLSFL